jgi:hypothetical protein
MHGLKIQLLFSLNWDKTHGRSLHSFSDRLGINVIALVRLYVRLNVLRRHQPNVVTLSPQRPPQKMCSATCLHPDPMNVEVSCIRQQLAPGTLLPNQDGTAQINTHQVKQRFTQIDPDRVYFHERSPFPGL